MITEADILSASVLIVDDQAANVLLLETLLADAGYTAVTSTMNPLEVCSLHLKHHYDLILLDLKMPGMDGFQVMEALNRDIVDSYLSVVVLTAEPGHKLRALQAGAKDFISKPFDLVEAKRAYAICWKCVSATNESNSTTSFWRKRSRSARLNWLKARAGSAVSPRSHPTGTGSRTKPVTSPPFQARCLR